MEKRLLKINRPSETDFTLALYNLHTLVVGSGAAGLNAAVQLRRQGIEDLLILTEGLRAGTSINTGSDKQTYYKLGLSGSREDSPETLAEALFAGGSMHGDLALVEASLSVRGFINLVNLGVPFPRDRFGQFVGYKTDHDPRQRATSVGPYTSREMCLALIREVRRLGIPVQEERVVVSLLTVNAGGGKRAAGVIALHVGQQEDASKNRGMEWEAYAAENVIFATGGPGGLYRTSVYPEGHTGGIGLALLAGAKAQSLPESQYGLASTRFRWNVSGSYMQVVPRWISTSQDGLHDENEFMRPYFKTAGDMNSAVFLKGYQWPFDTRKVVGGSSLIDILVYVETVIRGRRVFLDYRQNPEGFRVDDLIPEAFEYLQKSKALQETPFDRLHAMNPAAIDLYRTHGIDIEKEPLEVAVCAQHNNGGLAGNLWWESVNIKHLFPVGEVNGTHGVTRPGGSALNAGQVGGIRAAEYIASRYRERTLNMNQFEESVYSELAGLLDWVKKCEHSEMDWVKERDAFQARMSRAGALIRSQEDVSAALSDAWGQWHRVEGNGMRFKSPANLAEALRNRYLCYAHAVYLEAILFALRSGLGSRGSALVLDRKGIPVHGSLGEEWRFTPENPIFREKVLETFALEGGKVENQWVDRRPLPRTDAWFETTWAAFQRGEIFEDS